MHVRRGAARAAAALLLTGAAMLIGPAAIAQDADPCAPAADGSVPEMCQGGMTPEPAPDPAGEPDPCAPDAEGTAPEMCQGGEAPEQTDPCPPQPVEPGDGVVVDEGDQGIAVGEPNPGAPPSGVETDPAAEGEAKPEPAPEDPTLVDPPMDDPAVSGPVMDAPVMGAPTVICAFGVPVSAPADAGAPTAGGGVTAVGAESSAGGAANGAVSAGQLPRTGAKEQLLALAALGTGLLLVGAAANAAGRRRELQV